MSTNLTEPAYWDNFWKSPFGTSASWLSHYYWLLSRRLTTYSRPGARAIELGCGGSVWLPTLARKGVESWGIDYSDIGVARTKEVLAHWRADATVVRGDVFDAAVLPAAHFDLVYSMGLLEHFTDNRPYVDRLWDLAKPGGYVLTTVPNLGGHWGTLQKALDQRVFDMHRIYTLAELDQAHLARGFRIVEAAQFFGGVYPLSVDYSVLLRRLPALAGRLFIGGIWATQQLVGWSTAVLPQALRNPPKLAGHILGVYQKPAGASDAASAPPSSTPPP